MDQDKWLATLDGTTDDRWNLLAMATWALFFENANLSGKLFTLYDGGGCCSAGETSGVPWAKLEDKNNKFTVAHEIGHMVSLLVDSEGDGYNNPSYGANMHNCDGNVGEAVHGLLTRETQAVAMIEGIAGWYSAVTWNEIGTSPTDCGYVRNYTTNWDLDGDVEVDADQEHICTGDPDTEDAGTQAWVDGKDWLEDMVNAADTMGCSTTPTDRSTQFDFARYMVAMRTVEGLTMLELWWVWDDTDPYNWEPNGVEAHQTDQLLVGMLLLTASASLSAQPTTTRKIMVWIISFAACHGARPKDVAPKDSAPDTDTTPVDTTDITGGTGDTATTQPVDAWPYCAHQPRTETVLLTGADRFDQAGRSVDAADSDGDGCAELVTMAYGNAYTQPGTGSVYFVADPISGPLSQRADFVWEESNSEMNWVYRVAYVPPQVIWASNYYDGVNTSVALAFDVLGAPATEPIDFGQRAGRLYQPRDYEVLTPNNDIEGCGDMATPRLCLGSVDGFVDGDGRGAIWLFETPILGEISVEDHRTKLYGEEEDRAEQVEADDLDGDGLDDLVIGGTETETGKVALVSDPPEGDYLVWDVAYAVIDGVLPGADAGSGLATGDMDGDGHIDVMIGAPYVDGGSAYVITGPFGGASSVTDATVTVRGTTPGQWVGFDGAIGDFDGDGSSDLAVGASWSIYSGPEPGQVVLFPAVAEGQYTIDEAPIHLVSGSPDPDAFGISIAPADIDGDGLLDLVIGAPNDSRTKELAGSVTVVFGAGL